MLPVTLAENDLTGFRGHSEKCRHPHPHQRTVAAADDGRHHTGDVARTNRVRQRGAGGTKAGNRTDPSPFSMRKFHMIFPKWDSFFAFQRPVSVFLSWIGTQQPNDCQNFCKRVYAHGYSIQFLPIFLSFYRKKCPKENGESPSPSGHSRERLLFYGYISRAKAPNVLY